MSVGMAFLVFIGVTIVFMFVGVVVLKFAESRSVDGALTRSQREELARLRRLVKEINADAHKYQELEPNFTSVTIDKISNHYQKELES